MKIILITILATALASLTSCNRSSREDALHTFGVEVEKGPRGDAHSIGGSPGSGD